MTAPGSAPPAAPPVAARSVELPDPGDLLGRLPTAAAVAWVRHGQGLVGWGEAARVEVPPGADRFAWAAAWLRGLFSRADVDDQVATPGSGPVAFGSFGFDPSAGGAVVVPAVVLARRDGRAWLTTVGPSRQSRDALERVALQAVEGDGIRSRRAPGGEVRYVDGALDAAAWQRAVEQVLVRLAAGGLGKVVLARDLYALATEPIDARVLLDRLATSHPQCYTFACDGLVGATPELLVRQTGRTAESLVLAGTTGRGDGPGDDTARGAALLASAKDRAEHRYAVEAVRAALRPRCHHLRIAATPELLTLANVLHLATPVSAHLAGTGTVLDLVAALHPTPAVCGTPTGAAMDAIRELEGMDRGRYAGPVGWTDARGDGEFGIALRCAQLHGRQARLFAGCGIVAGSDPAAELAESRAKLRAMQAVL